MSTYKVAQDVEADDKLLGPFTFRQFIYLIIVAMAGTLAWFMGTLLLPLGLIPLPIIIFFGALALPLRKDQPMEIYLAAIVSFYLKPRRRLWVPDGIESLIEITVPKTMEAHRTKDLSQTEAEKRLSYLASIVDTGGWAIRGATAAPQANTAMQNDLYFEAQQTEDILGNDSGIAHNLDAMITQSDQRHKQQIMQQIQQTSQTTTPQTNQTTVVPMPQPVLAPVATVPAPSMVPDENVNLAYNPYPTSIHQAVIKPMDEPVAQPNNAATTLSQTDDSKPIVNTSEKQPSPDIINLANNPDLSIATIAHEAHRIQDKLDEEEVIISLR